MIGREQKFQHNVSFDWSRNKRKAVDGLFPSSNSPILLLRVKGLKVRVRARKTSVKRRRVQCNEAWRGGVCRVMKREEEACAE